MRTVSKRVGLTFLLALAGVCFLIAFVVKLLLGLFAVLAFVLLLLAPFVVAVVKARRRRARRAAGRTCSCCTGTVHDPVRVI